MDLTEEGKKEISLGDIKNKAIISGNKVVSTTRMMKYKKEFSIHCINQILRAEYHGTD